MGNKREKTQHPDSSNIHQMNCVFFVTKHTNDKS